MFESKSRKKILFNLVDLDGIGETQVYSLNNFFSNITNTRIIKDLIDKLTIKNYTAKNNDGRFSNKKLKFHCLTRKLLSTLRVFFSNLACIWHALTRTFLLSECKMAYWQEKSLSALGKRRRLKAEGFRTEASCIYVIT